MTNSTTVTSTCTECEQPFDALQWETPFGRKCIGRICDSCSDARELQRELDEAALRAEEAHRRLEHRREQSAIPAPLTRTRLELLDEAGRGPVLRAAADVIDGNGSTLTLLGPVGTGKTTIAAAIANALLERGPVRWVSVPALVSRLDARFGS